LCENFVILFYLGSGSATVKSYGCSYGSGSATLVISHDVYIYTGNDVPFPRNPALEHAAQAGETPQSYTNGAGAAAHSHTDKKADPTLPKGPEDVNSGEYGMWEGGGGDTNQSADISSTGSTNTDTSSGGGGSIASGMGGNYLSNLLPRSTDPRGGGGMMPDYGGGYNSYGGYPGYGMLPSQYRPRVYLPPLGANAAYLPQGPPPQQGQQVPQEDRQEKPVKKKKKPKGKE
jgi:hypothetical protein